MASLKKIYISPEPLQINNCFLFIEFLKVWSIFCAISDIFFNVSFADCNFQIYVLPPTHTKRVQAATALESSVSAFSPLNRPRPILLEIFEFSFWQRRRLQFAFAFSYPITRSMEMIGCVCSTLKCIRNTNITYCGIHAGALLRNLFLTLRLLIFLQPCETFYSMG
jgi:hypothetical protein